MMTEACGLFLKPGGRSLGLRATRSLESELVALAKSKAW